MLFQVSKIILTHKQDPFHAVGGASDNVSECFHFPGQVAYVYLCSEMAEGGGRQNNLSIFAFP